MKYKDFVIPLVCQSISGDREALEQLLLSQREIIAVIVRNWTRCQTADTEDISQEVEMRISKKISSLKHPEAFYSWLHTIVVRECNRYIRARNRLIPYESMICIEELLVEPDPVCIPLEYIEQIELRSELQKVLDVLPEMTKQIIFLHYGAEIEQKKIAEILGIPAGTVSSILFRARERLREDIAGY